jgi:hypothetical protein
VKSRITLNVTVRIVRENSDFIDDSGKLVGDNSPVRAGMTELTYKQYLDAAEKSPKEVAAAVSGLSEEVLRYKPSPEKWCVLEILGHLADVEIIYGYRLRQMLADTKPVIAPLDQDAWARNLNYLNSPPSELVAFYGLARHHNLRLLRTLKDADFSKSAFHPEMQHEVTVAELVQRMAGHGAAHLRQIEILKAASQKLSA